MIDKIKKEGDFILHSGDKSDVLYDVLEVVGTKKFLNSFKKFIRKEEYLVGIEFGGAILAAMSGKPFGIVRKDGTVYGEIPNNYSIIDDVITTGNSIESAIFRIQKRPKHVCCIVNRSSLDVHSMYEV